MNEAVPPWAFTALLAVFNVFLGLMIARLWKSLDDNTQALSSLRELLPTRYATKEEVNRHHEEDAHSFEDVRKNAQGLRDRVHAIDLRVTAIDGSVRDAQAGLRGG
jgi:uncharacterized membrane-anchored protein YhcB (DUF1043 family)